MLSILKASVFLVLLAASPSVARGAGRLELPAEMRQIGFQLIHRESGYQLLVPSGVVWDLSPGILSKPSDFKYERDGNQIVFRLGAKRGERAVVTFDLASLKSEYQEYNRKDEVTRSSSRSINRKFADTWAIWGPDGAPLPRSLAEYDSATHTLRIAEDGSKRDVRLNVPEGVQINIIEGKFLLLTSTRGAFHVQDRSAGEGRACQALLNLENHLRADGREREPVSWALLSDRRYSQSQMIGSIQETLDYLTASVRSGRAGTECAPISEAPGKREPPSRSPIQGEGGSAETRSAG